MKLQDHRLLDAVCGEYILGTLRGAARRRFEAVLAREPRVAQRLQELQALALPEVLRQPEVQPSPRVWRGLETTLALHRYRSRWYQRPVLWKAWAWSATAALTAVVVLQIIHPENGSPAGPAIAQLTGKEGIAPVTAQLSADGRQLALHAARPVLAGPNQSYELWLIPAGGKPVPVAVLGTLDTTFPLGEESRSLLRAGATLAVSTEPAGGSPTGQPTGTVILAGTVRG